MNCLISMRWLVYANVTVWVGLCMYVLFIAYKQKSLNQQLKKMEHMQHEK